MSKIRRAGISALALVAMCVAFARAEDISTRKMFIKDHANVAKRQVQILSKDPGVLFTKAGSPDVNGAALHVYGATDDFCVILPPGAGWVKKRTTWKYKSEATKSSAQVRDGKLQLAIRSGVTYSVVDDAPQSTVNAQVRFGTGERFCMRCITSRKEKATLLGKNCAAAPCDPEPSSCDSLATTTTTGGTTSTSSGATSTSTTLVTTTSTTVPSTTSTSVPSTTSTSGVSTSTTTSTTTSTLPTGGQVLKGALTATPGRFNYNLTLGLPGANSACNTNFPGTHACTYPELQSAEAAGDLDGLKDTGNDTVTSFWVINASPTPSLTQCVDDAVGGSNLNWEYGTAHTMSRGTRVDLNNAAGTLGAVQPPEQCNFSDRWVGCCQ